MSRVRPANGGQDVATEIGPFSTAGEMLAALDAGLVSSVELVEMHVDRIDEYDGALNAIAVRTADRARESATAADAARASGAARLAARAADDVEGVDAGRRLAAVGRDPTIAGSSAGERRPDRARVFAAGACLLGKTNIPVSPRRLAGRQPCVRANEQPVGPRPHARG